MWFQSYLHRRVQYVRCGRTASAPTLVMFGVPQLARSLGRFSFCCIWQICWNWSRATICVVSTRVCQWYADLWLLFTCRRCTTTTADVDVRIDEVASWMLSNRSYSSTPQRRRSPGAPRVHHSISSHRHLPGLATSLSLLPHPFMIWAFTSTLTSPWGHMSQEPCLPASQDFDRLAAYGDVFRSRRWSRWLCHWFTLGSTTDAPR